MLISNNYKDQLVQYHAAKPNWGSTARRWSQQVIAHAKALGAKTVLDYGSGTGSLRLDLEPAGLVVREYDPGVPGKEADPDRADMVVALDVLEHIEPECLTDVLGHMDLLAIKGMFAVIALYPAGNILPDGRNAHLIVESPEWWVARLTETISPVVKTDYELVVRPSRNPAKATKRALIVRTERVA